jgi:hypothetical protein
VAANSPGVSANRSREDKLGSEMDCQRVGRVRARKHGLARCQEAGSAWVRWKPLLKENG